MKPLEWAWRDEKLEAPRWIHWWLQVCALCVHPLLHLWGWSDGSDDNLNDDNDGDHDFDSDIYSSDITYEDVFF
jgi:hypothetical protein